MTKLLERINADRSLMRFSTTSEKATKFLCAAWIVFLVTSRLTSARGHARIKRRVHSFLKEGFEFKPGDASPVARLTLQIMGSVAEFERQVILERQREGIALAKQRGVYKGRKPIEESLVQTIITRHKMGSPQRELPRIWHRLATCYRYLKRAKDEKDLK